MTLFFMFLLALLVFFGDFTPPKGKRVSVTHFFCFGLVALIVLVEMIS